MMLKRVLLLTATLLFGSAAQAQEWPSRPITLVNAFAAGSNADVFYRAIAKFLSDQFGQPFAVESRPGAGGSTAAAQVSKAPADGSLFLFLPTGPAVINGLLSKSVTYDSVTDFTPIIMVGETPPVLAASPKLGAKTVGELIAFSKSNPGALNIGHAGAGSMGHLAGALFLSRAGLQGTLVGYRGPGPVVTDVIAGQIHAGFPFFVGTLSAANVLAVTSERRMAFLADVPTMQEAGVDVVATTWTALVGPVGLPSVVVERLNAAVNAYLGSAEGREQAVKLGIQPLGGKPADVTSAIRNDRAKWARVIAEANIKLDSN